MRIYTKTGDAGETSLFGGTRVAKNCLEIMLVGELDELNSALGVAVTEISDSTLVRFIENIQRQIFRVGAEVASLQTVLNEGEKIVMEDIRALEMMIDTMSENLPELNNFILPGGCKSSALLHHARSVCRRAERSLVDLGKKIELRPELYIFLNRLSDLLFTAARWMNVKNKTKEEIV